MKKLLLIGDSIRMGYCPFVKEMLQGKAEVYYSNDNSRFLQYTLRTLSDWQKLENWPEDIDTVHWNNGLWDSLHLSSPSRDNNGKVPPETTMTPANVPGDRVYDKEALTPPDMYEYMLGRVHRRIRQLFPKAEIVFATSTFVIEEMATTAYRSNEEIEMYNEIARRTLRPLGVRINELGAYSLQYCKSLHSDWVHYNAQGSTLLAKEVIEYLQKEGLI